MHKRRYCYHPGLFMFLLLMLSLSACSGVGGATRNGAPPAANGQTATATPAPSAPCATHATTTAEAWVSNKQVVGSINGGPETVLSTFSYPLGLPDEGQYGDAALTALAWAPDAQHLVVAAAVSEPYVEALYPYIVDTNTHAVTRVTLPASALASERESVHRVFAWADDHTLIIFGGFGGGSNGSGGTVTYRYDLSQNSLTPLPGVTAAYEGVVRCNTLFYLEVSPLAQIGGSTSSKGSALLHRYDLTTQSEIGAPITLGDTSTFRGAEGDVSLLGWDASLDGTKIAYQQTHVSLDSYQQPVTTSKFFAANADGSGATSILTGATANNQAFLAISPDGRLVAVTNAQPTPAVLSGSLSGGAAHYYQPDAEGPPMWLADSSGFEADMPLGSDQGIEHWTLNTGGGKAQGATVHQNSDNPAILP